MKLIQKSILKAISISTIFIITIAATAYFVFPQYLFVIPGSEVYASGIIDHKKIGQIYINNQPSEIYTASVRLIEDDPLNNLRAGETMAYIIPKDQWNLLSWGDTVKIKLLPSANAEIAEVFPSLKPREWNTQYESALTVDLQPNKTTYKAGEVAVFNVTIRNDFTNQTLGNSLSIGLTLFESNIFWVFENGKEITANPTDYTTKQVTIEPNQEYSFTFQWTISQISENSNLIYYIRTYIGYFTENPENTLLGTTIIAVEN